MLRPNTAEVKGIPNLTNNLQPTMTGNNSRLIICNNSNSNSGATATGSPVDALPKQFIASMKTLFDILDDKQTGFVRLSDIEKGWQDDGCKNLPRGVLDSLRKLTPANGLLSFERFCAGLKLCLLRNQAETTIKSTTAPLSTPVKSSKCKASSIHLNKSPRPPSAPVLEIENPRPNTPWNNAVNALPSVVRPRNISASAQRAISMPQLSPDSSELEAEMTAVNMNTYGSPPPPPKPPRAAAVAAAAAAAAAAGAGSGASLNKTGIRHALQNWQMGLLLNEMDASEIRTPSTATYFHTNRGSADGGSSSATDSAISASQFGSHNKKGSSGIVGGNGGLTGGNSKRRETRRHTLQNGIDYNMLRRLKQYEEEREVLLLGLDAIEKTREWYLQQVENVQEKIRCLGRMGEHVDHWSEVQQERLNFQRARVLEINRSLAALSDGWERGCFPLNFNLPLNRSNKTLSTASSHLKSSASSNGCPILYPIQSKERLSNHYLTSEMQIKRLEHENQGLVRELFELRQCLSSRHIPARGLALSQPQSSPVCSSSSGGGLVDADVVY